MYRVGRHSKSSKLLKWPEICRQLLKEKADFLLFKVLIIDTAGCLLKCSGHGHCDPITKRCICSQLWMENLIQCYIHDGESSCGFSIKVPDEEIHFGRADWANDLWYC